MIQLLILIVGFVLLSGFFAMVDAAILNVSPAEVEVLIARKYWGAKQLKALLKHTTRAIIVIVIFTNITNILGPILVANEAVRLYGSPAIGIMTAILTLATIIFSEIIPKSIGAHQAPRIARRSAPFLLFLTIVLYPLVAALEWLVQFFKSGKRKVGTEEQIRALANIGGGEGHIDATERELIHRAFVLNDRPSKDVMTPLSKVVSIPTTMTIRDTARTVFRKNFSRYPLTGDSPSDFRGYVLSRDVLEALADGDGMLPVTTLERKLLSIPSSVPCDDLLNILRKNAAHIVGIAENGKIIGLATLEDVLEELVGELKDEEPV
jgi:CBS domain containing-hemolysin-like protein